MKTIIEPQKYGLKNSIVNKIEIVRNKKIDYSKKNFNQKNIKKTNMRDVCAKLKNDLKWYKDDMLNSNVGQNGKKIQENILTKEFSEKTASKLVEEWWLSS